MTERRSRYLALDPGDGPKGGHTGWASFDEQGDVIAFGQFHSKDATEKLTSMIHSDLIEVIVEDFKNHMHLGKGRQGQAARPWGRNETSKLIGKIEMLAELRNVPVVLQPNTNKAMGYMYMGMKQPANHSISHQYDACAHGVYRLQTIGVRPVGKALLDKLQ